MSGLSWIDIFLRLIPEGLIIILAGYAVSKKDINIKLYLLSSVILALATFGSRSLPINPALSMILVAIVAIIILVFMNKIKVVHAVISTVLCYILALLIEGANLIALKNIFHLDPNTVFLDAPSLLRNLYGLPSLLLFAAIVIIYYLIARRIKAKKNVTNE